jgi:mRNA interferase RelE/StbE
VSDAPWGIQVTSRFRRDLHRLPPRVATAVAEYVTAVLPENPLRLSKPLTGEFEGLRSARRGDYRVLFEVDEDARIVVLLRVAHRAHIYRTA